MDFSFSEEQIELRELAREILAREVTPERLKAVEGTYDSFDRELWLTLADANLLSLAVPEINGGMGYGILEICILLEEIGRAVALVPVLPTLLLAGLPIDRFGNDEQKTEWLTKIAMGTAMLTAALVDADSADPWAPATVAKPDGADWIISGTKLHVPAAHLADLLLVPARTPSGVGVFLVKPSLDGIKLKTRRISTGELWSEVLLDNVYVSHLSLLGGDEVDGAEVTRWMYETALVGYAATQIGVSERAIEITAAYVTERHQFGVPIGSFQAVQHRAADGFIDLQALRWTTWRAAWKLSRGLSAERETAVAKFWAADSGQRIASSSIHMHGGMGVDLDYPIHRYFRWSKALEVSLGGATPQLLRLGANLAEGHVQELS